MKRTEPNKLPIEFGNDKLLDGLIELDQLLTQQDALFTSGSASLRMAGTSLVTAERIESICQLWR